MAVPMLSGANSRRRLRPSSSWRVVAEQRLRAAVRRQDARGAIEHDHAVGGGVEDRGELGGLGAQRVERRQRFGVGRRGGMVSSAKADSPSHGTCNSRASATVVSSLRLAIENGWRRPARRRCRRTRSSDCRARPPRPALRGCRCRSSPGTPCWHRADGSADRSARRSEAGRGTAALVGRRRRRASRCVGAARTSSRAAAGCIGVGGFAALAHPLR